MSAQLLRISCTAVLPHWKTFFKKAAIAQYNNNMTWAQSVSQRYSNSNSLWFSKFFLYPRKMETMLAFHGIQDVSRLVKGVDPKFLTVRSAQRTQEEVTFTLYFVNTISHFYRESVAKYRLFFYVPTLTNINARLFWHNFFVSFLFLSFTPM